MAKVKVVLSWSGAASREVARVLRDWLPSVIQTVDPFMSEEDIQKGATWLPALQRALAEPQFGIICVTPDNLRAEWLQFEAGAMWKAFDEKRVCPFLFGMESAADLKPPLGLFQACVANNSDEVFRLVRSINAASPDTARLGDGTLERSFAKWIPDLRERLAKIEPGSVGRQHRTQEDILIEVLATVRSIAQEQAAARESASLSNIRSRLRESMRRSTQQKLGGEFTQMIDTLIERLTERDLEALRQRQEEAERAPANAVRSSNEEPDPKE